MSPARHETAAEIQREIDQHLSPMSPAWQDAIPPVAMVCMWGFIAVVFRWIWKVLGREH